MSNFHSRILLFGEYFALLGEPALCLPLLDRKILSDKNLSPFDPLRPFDPYCFEYQGIQRSLNFPLSSGMASSALLCLMESEGDLESAYELEHKFHLKSSGVDIAACYYSYPMIFQSKKIEKLNVGKFLPSEGLLLTYLGERESNLKEKSKSIVEQLSHVIAEYKFIYNLAKNSLQDASFKGLESAFEWNLELQRKLNVLPRHFDSLRKKHHLPPHTKMMGAGFGGVALSLVTNPTNLSPQSVFYPLEHFHDLN